MVSVTNLCGTLLTVCATMNNVPTGEVVAQISYDTVDSKQQLVELVEGNVANKFAPYTLVSEDIQDLFEGYLQYLKEQEELELKRQQELEEIARLKAIEEQYSYKSYRQTYYSVVEDNETNLGSGYNARSSEVQNINNIMHFNDSEFGWLPVYAINLDEVVASGQNSRGIWNAYGSVIELRYEDGRTQKGIVLDACGACRYAPKIDLWVYKNQQSLDISNVDFRYIRYGWGA